MSRVFLAGVIFLMAAVLTRSASGQPQPKKTGTRPPTTLTYYLSGVDDPQNHDALKAALAKLKSVKAVAVHPRGEHVTLQFDSHVVSYHQIAQAIVDCGNASGKKYVPTLKVVVPEYAEKDNAAKIDAIFSKKRLNQRVKIDAVDKARGEFVLRFLPLELDAAETAPQGFNGGHLNHPVHDAPPKGLGLKLIYVTEAPR